MKYELTDSEIRAVDAASVAMGGVHDAVKLMNALCTWPDPPPSDERWEQKIAAACEIAIGFSKLRQNEKAWRKRLETENQKLEVEIERLQKLLYAKT